MWLIFNLKKEFKKISNSFNKFRKEISELTTLSQSNQESIKELISKKEVDLMIREAILRVQSTPFREPIRTTPRTPMRKKADKILNKVEIMREIASLLQKGLSTEDIHNNIVNVKMLCKKTCFYKYLKEVREQSAELREQQPRTNLDK